MCDAVARTLRDVAIPEPQEDASLAEMSLTETANFYLLLVAICHQTQSLCGVIAGRYLRGWDYLTRKFEAATRFDRTLLDRRVWLHTEESTLRDVFHDEIHGATLSEPEARAALVRDLGEVMQRNDWESFEDVYRLAEGRITSGSPNLLGLLSEFRAYNDPVRKKSLFLLGIMGNPGFWKYADTDSLGPPVDYHEVRGHLRIGTVTITDLELRRKLWEHERVNEEDDVEIRSAVHEAIQRIASRPDMPNAIRLHYLFGHIFRAVCLRELPHCRLCPETCGLPDRYRHLLQLSSDRSQCPFASICESADATERYTEHRFDTDWY